VAPTGHLTEQALRLILQPLRCIDDEEVEAI